MTALGRLLLEAVCGRCRLSSDNDQLSKVRKAERSMIRERVMAGLSRAKADGT
jgi:DNA invertase Pin-like site-specific DNA recombinase